MAAYPKPLMSNSEISNAIRMRKKKIMTSEPEMTDTAPTPDLDANKISDIEQDSRVENWVGDPGMKSNSDEANMDLPAPESMSKEPMKSKVMPEDHGRMAYGGEVMEHSDPTMPSMEMETEVAGSPQNSSEMARRIGEGFQAGSKHMSGGMAPSESASEMIGGTGDAEGEMKRRTTARLMRLAGHLDSLGM
jgi:hypothetical protein